MSIEVQQRVPSEWNGPIEVDLAELYSKGDRIPHPYKEEESLRVWDRHDALDTIRSNLLSVRYPNPGKDNEARDRLANSVTKDYGHAIYFPWSGMVVRYPDQQDFLALRTARNSLIVTPEQQKELFNKKIAYFGLSVGSEVARTMASTGIGGAIALGDMDTIDVTNLNRLNATMQHVNLEKVEQTGRSIAEIDPFISQIHLPNGYNHQTNTTLDEFGPDLIIEETDKSEVKAPIMEWAIENGVTVISAADLGNTAAVHIHRNKKAEQPFNGRIDEETYRSLLDGTHPALPDPKAVRSLVFLAGKEEVMSSPELIKSFFRIGEEVAGLPQPRPTVNAGAALATVAARNILLGYDIPSGTYTIPMDEILGIESSMPPEERKAWTSLLQQITS